MAKDRRVIGWDGGKKEPVYAEEEQVKMRILEPCQFCGYPHIIAAIPKPLKEWKVGDPCPFWVQKIFVDPHDDPVTAFCERINSSGKIKILTADRELIDMFYRYLDEIGVLDGSY